MSEDLKSMQAHMLTAIAAAAGLDALEAVRIEALERRPGEILLGFGPGVGDPRWSLSPDGDVRQAAANLFRLLREADRTRPAGIAVSPIPHKGLGEAINDRLRRAAGFVG